MSLEHLRTVRRGKLKLLVKIFGMTQTIGEITLDKQIKMFT